MIGYEQAYEVLKGTIYSKLDELIALEKVATGSEKLIAQIRIDTMKKVMIDFFENAKKAGA